MPSEIVYLVEAIDWLTCVRKEVKIYKSKERAERFANSYASENGTNISITPIITED